MILNASDNHVMNDVMTTSEVMKYLKVSRKTVLKLVHEGKIAAQKVGKDFRYLKSEIDTFLRAGRPPEGMEKSYFNT